MRLLYKHELIAFIVVVDMLAPYYILFNAEWRRHKQINTRTDSLFSAFFALVLFTFNRIDCDLSSASWICVMLHACRPACFVAHVCTILTRTHIPIIIIIDFISIYSNFSKPTIRLLPAYHIFTQTTSTSKRSPKIIICEFLVLGELKNLWMWRSASE